MTSIKLDVKDNLLDMIPAKELELLLNNEDFEDLLLMFHIKQSENQDSITFDEFKIQVWK